MAIFEGAGVALVTPFHEDGSVNYEKLEQIVEEQIAGGTDAIVICGTTGESATLTEEEHMRTIRFAIDKVNHRIPVVAGTGSNSTATATQMSKEAAEAGAEGIFLDQWNTERTDQTLYNHHRGSKSTGDPVQRTEPYRLFSGSLHGCLSGKKCRICNRYQRSIRRYQPCGRYHACLRRSH